MPTRSAHDFVTGETPSASTFDDLPKGWIGYAALTSNVGSITTEATLTGLSVSPTVLASRKVRATVSANVQSTVANDVVRVRVKMDGTTIAVGNIILPTAGQELNLQVIAVEDPSTGSHAFTVTAERIAGTGTVQVTASTTTPTNFVVEDLGPAA